MILENITKTTPLKWRRLGNSLMTVALCDDILVMSERGIHSETIALVLTICAIAGKFLTYFFAETEVPQMQGMRKIKPRRTKGDPPPKEEEQNNTPINNPPPPRP